MLKIFRPKKCGCVLYHSDLSKMLEKESSYDLALFSPPYNLGSKSPKKTGGRKKGKYDAKSFGGMPDEQVLPETDYQEGQKEVIRKVFKNLKKDGVCVYNHMDRLSKLKIISPMEWLLPLQQEKTLIIRQTIIWNKGSTHNHTKAHADPQFEYIYVLTKPGAKIYFDKQDFYWKDRKNKGIGSVWNIPREVKKFNKNHTAPFPLRMARHCIRLWCPPLGLVCDPYSGSGTTMIASYKENRRFVGSERLKTYFDMSIDRFNNEGRVDEK